MFTPPRVLPRLINQRSEHVETYKLPAEKLIVDNPDQTVWMDYTDGSGQFMVGVWQSEVGTWRVNYTEDEYCHILEGESVLTSDTGEVLTVRTGDSFVIPSGFVGTWEVTEPCTKRFVIFEAKR